MNALKVQNLAASYRKNTVLTNVSFTVEAGTLTGIVGPNGAGKSTLIKTLLQLHPSLTGEVRFFGSELHKVKSKIGYVPQRSS